MLLFDSIATIKVDQGFIKFRWLISPGETFVYL